MKTNKELEKKSDPSRVQARNLMRCRRIFLPLSHQRELLGKAQQTLLLGNLRLYEDKVNKQNLPKLGLEV